MSESQPVLIDKDRDLLDHTLDNIDVEEIKYYEDDDEDGRIKIVVVGSFNDEEQAEKFLGNTNKDAIDAYERVMKGTVG
jgi:hypothetical protein